MTPEEIRALTLCQVRDHIAAGVLTSARVTEAALAQAAGAVAPRGACTATPALARVMAATADVARSAGKSLGPLHGVPVAVEDAPAIAPLAARLRAAGAVFVARFAAPVVPRGAAAGDGMPSEVATAVALGMAYAAVGTTCPPTSSGAVVSLRQTSGRVRVASRMPLWRQLNGVASYTRRVADARCVADALASGDARPRPSRAATSPPPADVDLAGIRIGLPPSAAGAARVGAAVPCREALARLASAGATIVPLSIPATDPRADMEAAAVDVIATSDASAFAAAGQPVIAIPIAADATSPAAILELTARAFQERRLLLVAELLERFGGLDTTPRSAPPTTVAAA